MFMFTENKDIIIDKDVFDVTVGEFSFNQDTLYGEITLLLVDKEICKGIPMYIFFTYGEYLCTARILDYIYKNQTDYIVFSFETNNDRFLEIVREL